MQSIGERLEEARKRRGISVREASEATKIRGDFLLNFENNQFDVGLPELYVRGFLRNYSSFLKIDGDKLVTDYTVTLLGESRTGRKEQRELFGRMELPDRQRAATDNAGQAKPAASTPPRHDKDDTKEPSFRERERDRNRDLINYAKIGGVALAGIIAILLIIWLGKAIIGGSNAPSTAQKDATTPTSTVNAPAEPITLIATDTVRVEITQTLDNKVIFDDTLARDKTQTLTKHGPVVIKYNNGNNLIVVKDGKRYRMSPNGFRSSLP